MTKTFDELDAAHKGYADDQSESKQYAGDIDNDKLANPQNSSTEDFFLDDKEAYHRKKAVKQHQKRAFAQIRNTLTAVLLAASAPFVWRMAFGFASGDMPVWLSTMGFLNSSTAVFVILALVTFYLIYSVGDLAWYRRERWLEWGTATANADAREPETCARGFMNVFRLYARTKRKSIYTMLFGVTAIFWSSMGLVALYQVEKYDFITLGLGAIAMLHGSLALIILWFGYDISRRFLPGKILVQKILILSFLATTSQTDYNEARRQSVKLQQQMTDEKPWWFYSYRKRPKKS